MMRVLFVAAMLVMGGCGGSSGGSGDDAPADASGKGPIVAPAGTWTWVPIEGMTCADGTPTGIGVNLSDTSPDVTIFMAGGGACWDLNTCFTLSSAVHITGGYGKPQFDTEIASINGVGFWSRGAPNPFKDATYIYVPYCTGDLHDGANVATYDASHVVHHVGRTNASTLMARVAATRPQAASVWLIGVSAGGYGAAFDWDLARSAWPASKVHVLADSSPLVLLESTRWAAMQASWKMTFPSGCSACATDLGAMPAALRTAAKSGERYALLANTRDQTISTYFGITMDQLQTETLAAQAAMSPSAGQAAFVVAGTAHVLLGNPAQQTSTGVVLANWLTQWATGDAAWANAGP
jgi:hypothetical protein